MAYQSPENAQKLRDMPRVATNNADPARLLMDGNPSAQPNSSQQDFASPSIMQRLGAAGTSNQSDDPLRMMQRLGAAVRGESFEFNNKLDAKDKQLSQDRKQAALADLSQVGDMLNKGYVDEARQLLVDRVGKIEQLGGNSTGTTRLLDIVDKGNTGLATTIVNQELEKAYMVGLLKRPPSTDKGMTDYQAEQIRLREIELNQTKQKQAKPSEASIARKEAKQQQAKDYETYKQVSTDLKDTYKNIPDILTGSLQGNLPAASQSSRMFETTQKQMLPLLKDVFRKPGEGTFTEGDQRLLTELLPNRTMNAEEFDVAIRRLDAVVAMKVSQADLTIAQVLEKLDQEDRARRGEVPPPVRDQGNQDALRKAVYGSPKIDSLVAKHSSSGAK